MGEEPTEPKPSPHPTPRNGVLFFKNRFPKTVYIGLLELLIATGQGANAHRPPPYAVLRLEALIISELASSSPNIHFELSGERFSIPIRAFRRAGLPHCSLAILLYKDLHRILKNKQTHRAVPRRCL